MCLLFTIWQSCIVLTHWIGEASKVSMHGKYTVSNCLSCHLHSVGSQVCLHNFHPSYSKLSHSSYSSQASLLAVFAHWKTMCTLLCWKVVRRATMFLVDRMRRTVALNYSLNRNTEYARQIIYRLSLTQLDNVWRKEQAACGYKLYCGQLRLVSKFQMRFWGEVPIGHHS